MCGGFCGQGIVGLGPHGVEVTPEMAKAMPKEAQEAWDTIDAWWQAYLGNTVKRADVPEEVQRAMKVFAETPLPTLDGLTGEDSCYYQGLIGAIID